MPRRRTAGLCPCKRGLLEAELFFALVPVVLTILYLPSFVRPVSTLMLADLATLQGYDRRWVPLDEVVQTLKHRPSHVHVVLTGRDCPPEIIEIADTVSEVRKIKHAYEAGIPAQRGIED